VVFTPDAEFIYSLFIVIDSAPFGIGPAFNTTFKPEELHSEDETINGENPELVAVTDELGLNIPIEYKITATMTMTRMAQP
jgi:hypothetical protein